MSTRTDPLSPYTPVFRSQLVSDATTDRTDDVGERIVKRTPLMGLDAQGIRTDAQLHWNLLTAPLVEAAVIRGEGHLAADGPPVVATRSDESRVGKAWVSKCR